MGMPFTICRIDWRFGTIVVLERARKLYRGDLLAGERMLQHEVFGKGSLSSPFFVELDPGRVDQIGKLRDIDRLLTVLKDQCRRPLHGETLLGDAHRNSWTCLESCPEGAGTRYHSLMLWVRMNSHHFWGAIQKSGSDGANQRLYNTFGVESASGMQEEYAQAELWICDRDHVFEHPW
jgi:hypothetical protein